MRRIILIMALVMVFSLAGMSSSVFARDDEYSRKTLKGLNGVFLQGIFMDKDSESAGIEQKQIQSDVELKLKLAGIKVLTKEEHSKDKEPTSLAISINTYKYSQDVLIYYISIELSQVVYLMRDPNIMAIDETWSVDRFGNTSMKYAETNIRANIKDGIDRFIYAYLSVNPKT